MAILLNKEESVKLKKFEIRNKRLWLFGLFQVLLVSGICLFLSFNADILMAFLREPPKEERLLLGHLNEIIPQTSTEEYLLEALKSYIPVTSIILKGILFSFILGSLFSFGLLMVGFACYQKKMINFIRLILDK